MMNYVLYLITFFLIFSVAIGIKKLYRYHADINLLESIDEKTKRKIIDNQTITIINRKSGYDDLDYNSFCEIIVGERKKHINIIDVLPKNNK